SARKEGIAGPQTCTYEAKTVEPLLLKPIKTGARVDDGLAGGIDCAADVRGHGIIRSTQPGRHARIMIRQTQTQRRYAEPLETCTEGIVLRQLCIPVREDDNRAAVRVPSGEPACADNVIFRVGG